MTATKQTSTASVTVGASFKKPVTAHRYSFAWTADQELSHESPLAQRLRVDDELRLALQQDLLADLMESVIHCRTLRGLSQQQLAERMGSSQAAISRIESGRANPRASTIVRLAEVLRVAIRFEFIPCERIEDRRPAVSWWNQPQLSHAIQPSLGTSMVEDIERMFCTSALGAPSEYTFDGDLTR